MARTAQEASFGATNGGSEAGRASHGIAGAGRKDSAAGAYGVASNGGQGLLGMRERVALYGGELHAGPRPEGGFVVKASLPIEP